MKNTVNALWSGMKNEAGTQADAYTDGLGAVIAEKNTWEHHHLGSGFSIAYREGRAQLCMEGDDCTHELELDGDHASDFVKLLGALRGMK